MNRFKRFLLPILMPVMAIAIVVAAQPPSASVDRSQETQYRQVAQQIKLFGDIYKYVTLSYVDPVDQAKFIKAGIDGMLGTLDPYTVFIEPEETTQLEDITQGKYGGIGIEIGTRGKDRELTVISPIEDTPAARKGLRSGDVIIAVDGKSTAGFTTQDATKLIRGVQGTNVTLTIRRPGYDKPLEYVLTREEIRIHDVAYAGMVNGDIGLIKLAHFSSLADDELDSSLSVIMKNKPKGIILDLRSNPGGLLPSAINVAQEFLKPGDPIVSTHGRAPQSDRSFQAGGNPKALDIPLAVLVNGGSASASEIVAGAIQDLDRGVIIGTQSFGKGLVQSVRDLSDGAVLKITTARYYTPSGRLIQRDRPRPNEFALMAGPDDEDISPESTAAVKDSASKDSTNEKFATRAGREVFGGGGITPDIKVELPTLGPIEIEMFRRDLFFGFISDWLVNHPRPDTVHITDQMLAAFDKYLDSMKFEPPVPGDDQIKALRKVGEQDSLGSQFFTELDQLRKSLSGSVSLNQPKVREFIKQSLDRELASALGGREWRIRSTFDEDIQLQKAVEVLHDKNNYLTLLTTQTTATKSKSGK
jgi:carboxyl-terminal processing protease